MSFLRVWVVVSTILFVGSSDGLAQTQPRPKPLAVHIPDGTRHWLGNDFWGNRLQDWRSSGGRIECVADSARLPMRTASLVTRQIDQTGDGFRISFTTGVASGPDEALAKDACTGIQFGIGHGKLDPRAAALVHQWPGPGAGYLASIDQNGALTLRDLEQQGGVKSQPLVQAIAILPKGAPLEFTLAGTPSGNDQYTVTVTVNARTPTATARVQVSKTLPRERMLGTLALVSHRGSAGPKQGGRFYFENITADGSDFGPGAVDVFSPIFSSQYTLSRGVMKLTAQMLPLGEDDPLEVVLQANRDGEWTTIATTEVLTPSFTAPFRIADWDDSKDHRLRLSYTMGDRTYTRAATVRKDPVEQKTITVAGFTGNHNNAHYIGRPKTDWMTGLWFPHHDLTTKVETHDADILFFSGDQVYEGRSPTFADTKNIQLDYLYKWYLWCWAYRDLTATIPTITIPDDHDVFQGNIWGQGGRKSPGRDHDGGYVHPAEFVKLVESTQTSHLPDPYDPTPVGQGIGVYYTDLLWGGVSMAVLEDRKFKSGCNRPDMPPSGTGRPDHFNDPNFDVARLDIPGVTLLGDRQLKFLEDWAGDWKGVQMKMAVSQTIFANMATHHGPGLKRLIADLDSNGWPQTGRNKALTALRKARAFHLAGDQHLATMVHHGIDQHDDAIWSFCVPSIANFYPRAWAPEINDPYEIPDPKNFLGQRRDGFGHPVTVYAATNPGRDMGHEPKTLHNGMPGYGIVVLDKEQHTITSTCWPRFVDPTAADAKPYTGWPKTIKQDENDGRKPVGYLPEVVFPNLDDIVVKVVSDATGELVYATRCPGNRFRPPVYAEGTYTLTVGNPDVDVTRVLNGLAIDETGKATRSFDDSPR